MSYSDELNVIIDALRDYAEGSDRYEADDEEEAERITGFGVTAREIKARAEELLALPEERLTELVGQAQLMLADLTE